MLETHADSNVRSSEKASWPYNILYRQCNQKTARRKEWHVRHHVVQSISNVDLPKHNRCYFDNIPAVGRAPDGEFEDLMRLTPNVTHDVSEHEDRLKRRFQQFPYFLGSKLKHRLASSNVGKASQYNNISEVASTMVHASEQFSSELLLAASSTIGNGAAQLESLKPKRMKFKNLSDGEHMESFIEWAQTTQSSLVTLWHRLDMDGNMRLRKMEFKIGLKRLNYNGDIEQLWKCLDRDGTGSISFLEFAPDHAIDLAKFKYWAENNFGCIHNFFRIVDINNDKKVTWQEFKRACVEQGLPSSLHGSIGILFQLVDNPDDKVSSGVITESEMTFLEVWKPPIYLYEQADEGAKQRFQKGLIARYSTNPIVAWRMALDRDSSMRVSFEEFCIACKGLAQMGVAEASPHCGLAALYCAFDRLRAGWFTIQHWDEGCYKILRAFHDWAKPTFGKVSDFVRATEKERGCGIDFPQFRSGMKEAIGLRLGDCQLLFEGLLHREMKTVEVKKDGSEHGRRKSLFQRANMLFAHDLLFLDAWQPEQALQEVEAWKQITLEKGTEGLRRNSLSSISDRALC